MNSASVSVQTVLGAIDASDLGVTLMHEHTLRRPPDRGYQGVRAFSASLRDAEVTAGNAWLVREDPYVCLDNRELTDVQAVAEELSLYLRAGGRTIVDNSNGVDRDPELLVQLAEQTGVNLVMGSGLGDVPASAVVDPARYAEQVIAEHREGVELSDGRRIRPGVIGEIGVGLQFTAAERAGLRGAALAQLELGVPLMIHLPGWLRRGHEVVDLVLDTGVEPASVVLCHMDPSGADSAYQLALAQRGVWLEFDMIGMPNNYPGEGQSPSPDDTVTAVSRLIRAGYASRVLLSQDVGMKTMWTRFGGNGYGYVLTAFLPRLIEAGVDADVASSLLQKNPYELFIASAE